MEKITAFASSNILNSYEDQGVLFLKSQDVEEIVKGRTGEPIGSKKEWGGKPYIKTATGWKAVGKNGGAVKQAHDLIHGSEPKLEGKAKELYDDMVEGHTKKHADDKAGYVQLHKDVMEDSKEALKNKNIPTNEKEHHEAVVAAVPYFLKHVEGKNKKVEGAEVGKEYNHNAFGKVTVTKVDKNDDDNAGKVSHHVTFKDKTGKEEMQGINGFKTSTTSPDSDGKSMLDREKEGDTVTYHNSEKKGIKKSSFDEALESFDQFTTKL